MGLFQAAVRQVLDACSETIEGGGGRTRARTWDPLIKSQLLYQLSYAPGTIRKSLAGRRRLAKRPPGVQQRGQAFPLRMVGCMHAKKPPESGGF
jgi:hypothetical protein